MRVPSQLLTLCNIFGKAATKSVHILWDCLSALLWPLKAFGYFSCCPFHPNFVLKSFPCAATTNGGFLLKWPHFNPFFCRAEFVSFVPHQRVVDPQGSINRRLGRACGCNRGIVFVPPQFRPIPMCIGTQRLTSSRYGISIQYTLWNQGNEHDRNNNNTCMCWDCKMGELLPFLLDKCEFLI